MKRFLLILLLIGVTALQGFSQCAMCRSTVVNNVSNGDQMGLAAGLNTGIIYLFVTPHLLVALMGLLWYRDARAQQRKTRAGLDY